MLEAESAELLAEFIRLHDFEFGTALPTTYAHMGATITDAILQAGLSYNTVVYPRVNRLLSRFGNLSTTTDFILLMSIFSLEELISFTNKRKTECIWTTSLFLQSCGVETESQLSAWLRDETNEASLLAINGIGPKTVDYMKTLVGLNAFAIDRHLFAFLGDAGLEVASYAEARNIFCETADLLGIEYSILDRTIWSFMSERKTRNERAQHE